MIDALSDAAVRSSALVQLVSGPEDPTRGALAFAVAAELSDQDVDVNVVLIGNACWYCVDKVRESSVGVGLGPVQVHYSAARDRGVTLWVSLISATARDISAEVVEAVGARWASPRDVAFLACRSTVDLVY